MPTLSKAELRNAGLKRRDAVDAGERARFAARLAQIAPRLVIDGSTGDRPPVASVFSPIGSEPDTLPMIEALEAAGVTLALPIDASHGAPLLYRRFVPGDALAPGPLGIAEPLAGAPPIEPDVLFTPAAAFDRRGHRIGYGAGNVDRTIAALRARKPVWVVAVAFSVQEVPAIPDEPRDEPVDIVVTENEMIVCRA